MFSHQDKLRESKFILSYIFISELDEMIFCTGISRSITHYTGNNLLNLFFWQNNKLKCLYSSDRHFFIRASIFRFFSLMRINIKTNIIVKWDSFSIYRLVNLFFCMFYIQKYNLFTHSFILNSGEGYVVVEFYTMPRV